MRYKTKTSNIMAFWLAVAVLVTSGGLWAMDGFSKIYIFGDSLSDPGNIYALTGEKARAPYEPVPSAPYAIGGHQFSNGKTWAQHFARKLHLNKSGKAAYGSSGKHGNYAFGGTRLAGPSLALSAVDQVMLFLGDHGGVVDGNALYVLQFGGNDVHDALETGDPVMAASIIGSAIEAEIGLMLQLYYSGARNFLVVNVPNIGLTPAVGAFGDSARYFGAFLSQSFNDGLAGALDSGVLPDASINTLDLFGIINNVAANPYVLGIEETTEPCLRFGVKKRSKCHKPKAYLFWDAVHPTAVVHKHIGNVAASMYR